MDNLFSAEILARIQFAFTISFHIIFPALSIGLAGYLAYMQGMYLKTKQAIYMDAFNYWLKKFAVVFGMGVVSGIVMSYQFGTNWSVFADKTGAILGPLMGYEVMTAFFLEAGFLGIMLFGHKRVGEKLHFFATLMVAVGTSISAFWILAANSWMHTPAGYAIDDIGNFIPQNWFEIVFNPSFPYRLVHMLLAAYLTASLVVAAVAAFHLLRDRSNRAARLMFSMAMWVIAVIAPLQIVAGDMHGLNTLEYQPAKVAAMEGHFETQQGAPLILFGLPNQEEKRVDWALEVPKLGSLILTHDWNGEVKGLNAFPEEDWPKVSIVFWCFRIMVGLGMLMLLLGAASLLLRWKRRLFESTWFLRAAVAMGPAGFVAILAGWFVTEVGRQPFTVYGLLRTSESLSPVAAEGVLGSLIAFVVVYLFVFGMGTFYLLRKMAEPPHTQESAPQTVLSDHGEDSLSTFNPQGLTREEN